MKTLRAGWRLASSLVVVVAATGCASAASDGKHRLWVDSDPPGALAVLGEQSVTTPGTLILRGVEPVTIRFHKAGCEPTQVVVRRERTGDSARRALDDGGGPGAGPIDRWTPEPGAPGCGGGRTRVLVRLLGGAIERADFEYWPASVAVRLDCAASAEAEPRAFP